MKGGKRQITSAMRRWGPAAIVLLCTGACLISEWRSDAVWYTRGTYGPGLIIANTNGGILCGIGDADGMRGPGWSHISAKGEGMAEVVEWWFIYGDEPRIQLAGAGFRFATGPQGLKTWAITIPYWFLILVFGAISVRQLRARVLAGTCPTCGYDLRATPERCPECGTAV